MDEQTWWNLWGQTAYEHPLRFFHAHLSNGEMVCSKWYTMPEVSELRLNEPKRFSLINNRTLMHDEIVLDFDSDTEKAKADSENVMARLNGVRGIEDCKRYFSGSKGYHVHLKCYRMEDFDKIQRKAFRLNFLKSIDLDGSMKVDLQKSIDDSPIALENTPHWKTGRLKQLV